MAKGLVFIKEHDCEVLSKIENIAITQYEHDGLNKWFWCFNKQLHQIVHCPYCGDKLEEAPDEDCG